MPSQTGESDDEVSLHTLPKSPLLRRVVIVAAPRNFNNAATSSGVLRPSSARIHRLMFPRSDFSPRADGGVGLGFEGGRR
ncbi:hypothetical protein, partial [Streptomyces mirabilis]|uniref:hypothetical protein n=1 Tax=Streptomyces mirabilis TaxID=68239 RepID=UPI003818EEB5